MSDLADALAAQTLAVTQYAMAQAATVNTQIALGDYFKPVGALYETVPRWATRGPDIQPSSANIHCSAICLPAGLTIGSVTFVTGDTGGTRFANQWFCLQDSINNLLAVTADDLTNPWPAATAKTLPIAATATAVAALGVPATFTTTYTGLYYLGITAVAQTMPFLQATGVPFYHAFATDLPLLAGINGIGVTKPPAFPFNAGTPARFAGAVINYAYVS